MSLTEKNIADKSDQELLLEYRLEENLSAFETLFLRYSHLIFLVCMKYLKNEPDSQDALMEIFEQSLVDLQKYEISNFRGWLYLKTRNFCLYKIRKKRRSVDVLQKFKKSEKNFMENSAFDTLIGGKQIRIEKLPAALEKLAEDQKRCLQLFYFEKKTYQQIAEATGLKLNKVKSCIQNGKRNLKNWLKQTEAFQDEDQ